MGRSRGGGDGKELEWGRESGRGGEWVERNARGWRRSGRAGVQVGKGERRGVRKRSGRGGGEEYRGKLTIVGKKGIKARFTIAL